MLPAWLAVMGQVPTASRITAEPDTEHIELVVVEKLTGKPEDALALKLTVPVNRVVDGMAAKVMV